MTSFNELFDSTIKVLKDRLSNPFYGTFVISWCIWNWKPIYFTLFIDDSKFYGASKIDYLLGIFYNTSTTYSIVCNYFSLLILPLVSAFIFTFVVPKLMTKWLGKYWKEMRIRNDLQKEIENDTLLTKEESLELSPNFSENT